MGQILPIYAELAFPTPKLKKNNKFGNWHQLAKIRCPPFQIFVKT